MSETGELMLDCIDGLASMVTILAVEHDAEAGGVDAEAYYRAYAKYSAAHYKLIHKGDDHEDG